MSATPLTSYRYIEEFSCLADACPDNCCHDDWRISIDDEHAQLYQEQYPPLYAILARDNQGYYMKRDKGQCPALDDGLCAIHRDHGVELLSDTCMNYPRMYRQIGPFFTKAATMSCPEIARICLTTEAPFTRTEGELPPHHDAGKGLTPASPYEPDQQEWQAVQSALLNLVNDEHLSTEQLLLKLWALGQALPREDVGVWPALIDAEHGKETRVSLASLPEATIAADSLLLTTLETLTRPGSPEVLRQILTTSYSVSHEMDDNAEEVPFFTLQVPVAEHILRMRDYLAKPLRRFVAGEVTRTGFPFISTSSAGKDYGEDLRSWAATLVIRTLALRTILGCLGAHLAADTLEESMLIEVVYAYCRKVNHLPTGGCERNLRQQVLSSPSLLKALICFERQ